MNKQSQQINKKSKMKISKRKKNINQNLKNNNNKIYMKKKKNKHQNQKFIREVLFYLFKIMIKLILIIIDLQISKTSCGDPEGTNKNKNIKFNYMIYSAL